MKILNKKDRDNAVFSVIHPIRNSFEQDICNQVLSSTKQVIDEAQLLVGNYSILQYQYLL